MTDLLDQQKQLLEHQYADSGNLNARAELHRRFSTNTTGWHPWAFDQFDLPAAAYILELGCGPGWLWHNNRDRIPTDWQITLTDFSAGMVDEARANLGSTTPGTFTFEQCDAQNLPFEDATFDAVIANHMLYHIPDIAQALREVYRVLKAGGRFYAATNGIHHMQEVHTLGNQIAPDAFTKIHQEFRANPFDLESGAQQLEAVFTPVEIQRYPDKLIVTETKPLIAYILSMVPEALQTDENIAPLRARIDDLIATDGAITITKNSGLFIAQKT